MTVHYKNDIMRCQLCHCVEESNGSMISLNNCLHTYHISCLIDYAYVNKNLCPECNEPYNDIRFNIALAFKRQSLLELQYALI